jgi:hypothetical protein
LMVSLRTKHAGQLAKVGNYAYSDDHKSGLSSFGIYG